LLKATDLVLSLSSDHWLAVADGIRRGSIRWLTIYMRDTATFEATEAVKAIASAISQDRNLECLTLEMENGFTDEAGVALAKALTVNTTLRRIALSIDCFIRRVRNRATFGVSAHQAFGAMLRINTGLVLRLPPLDYAVADDRLIDSRNQMLIEQRLNEAGRGRLLASRQTTKDEWVYLQ
jgi:hypothetical protein